MRERNGGTDSTLHRVGERVKNVIRDLARNRRVVWRFDYQNSPNEIGGCTDSDHGGCVFMWHGKHLIHALSMMQS